MSHQKKSSLYQKTSPCEEAFTQQKEINQFPSATSSEDEEEAGGSVNHSPKVSFMGTVCNQIMLNLGTGILGMPKYMAAAGVANALVIIAFSLLLNYVSVMALVHAAEKHKVFEMEMLVEKLRRGRMWSWVCWVGVMISFFIVLLCYMIAFRDSVMETEQAYRSRISENSSTPDFSGFSAPEKWTFEEALLKWQAEDHSGESKMIFTKENALALCSLLVLPLSFLPMHWLSVTSTFAVAINLFILVVIVGNFFLNRKNQALPNGHLEGDWVAYNDICLFSLDPIGNIGFVSVMMMAICVQPCLIPMYEEMEDRSPAKYAKTMKISSLFCFILFAVFSSAAYATFGNDLDANVLKNLPRDALYSLITQIGMAIVMVTAFPLMLLPIVSGIKNRVVKTATIIGVVFICFLVTISFPDVELDTPSNLAGAVSACFFLALFPSLVALQLLGREYFGEVEGTTAEAEELLPASSNEGKYLEGSLPFLGKVAKKRFFYGFIGFGFLAMILGVIWPSAPLVPGKWKDTGTLQAEWSGKLPKNYVDRRVDALPALPAYLKAVKNALASGERPEKVPDQCKAINRELFFDSSYRPIDDATEYKEGLLVDTPMGFFESLRAGLIWETLTLKTIYKRTLPEKSKEVCFANPDLSEDTSTTLRQFQSQLDPVTRALVIKHMLIEVGEKVGETGLTMEQLETDWANLPDDKTGKKKWEEPVKRLKEAMNVRINSAMLKKVYDAETANNKEEVCAVKLTTLVKKPLNL